MFIVYSCKRFRPGPRVGSGAPEAARDKLIFARRLRRGTPDLAFESTASGAKRFPAQGFHIRADCAQDGRPANDI
jgi:hypothetical protein